MLFHARIPTTYWVEAFSTATYIINRLPSGVLDNKSSFEILFSTQPTYPNFRVFGCRVYPYLRDYAPNKLAPRSIPCIFMGYATQYKGYKCLDPQSSRMYVTRHARFNETSFPYDNNSSSSDLTTLLLSTYQEEYPTHNISSNCQPNHPSPTPPASTKTPPSCILCKHDPPMHGTSHANSIHTPQIPNLTNTTPSTTEPTPQHTTLSQTEPTHSSTNSQTSPTPTEPFLNSPSSTQSVGSNHPPEASSVHPMVTRSKVGVFKPNPKHRATLARTMHHSLYVALLATPDPKGFRTASKSPHWMNAMQEEIKALQRNNTWSLVPRPASANIVGSKWVFRTKYHSDGSIDRHKARLVAQGFTQIPGIDFSHTFSPVVKASTVRVVLSLAVINKWPLHQLDVNNAFLNGSLAETVYMEQPPGFIDSSFPDYVCKLSKALYGLKQAPRAWFQRLSSFLVTYGFTCSRADTSLFVFNQGDCLMYLLVYVDDLILTGNKPVMLANFIKRLHNEFAIKDLGSLNYFLGLEVIHTNDGLFLSQAKYAHDILNRAGLLDAKPVPTPLATTDSFTSTGTPYSDPTFYRSIVGALQYLTITRPDLAYAVNQACQFLHTPTEHHFQLVKRILRYIKGTISHGLVFQQSKHTTLLGYSDADWARCIETRRSTYGYSIFLGGNLVSWSAKKQPTVSRSSCESEYRAMANTAAEIIWITHLLRELHALPPDRPTLLCDNRSALFMSQNPVSHKRAKHIDLDYHFVRELVMFGKLHTRFVPTKLQLADIFTKSLPKPQFEHFRELLRVCSPPSRLRGDNR
ncbi:putative RNA-directed DNA polymerase [Helianthus annuus]|nr:putative RNA-directed DNA polymerase [Helianthus annuus]